MGATIESVYGYADRIRAGNEIDRIGRYLNKVLSDVASRAVPIIGIGTIRRVLKGGSIQVCHTVGNVYFKQRQTVHKRPFSNGSDSVGNVDRDQSGTRERVITDLGQSLGKDDVGYALTTPKRLASDSGHSVRDGNTGQTGVGERVIFDRGQIRGKHDALQVRTSAHKAGRDNLHGRIQIDSGQRCAIVPYTVPILDMSRNIYIL